MNHIDTIRQNIKDQIETGGEYRDYAMIRDAKHLEMDVITDEHGKPVVQIDLGNGFKHTFSANSRVSKHLIDTPRHVIHDRLRTGAYFFVEEDNKPQLIDFCFDAQRNFIHDDSAIENMMSVLGVSSMTARTSRVLTGNTQTRGLYLGSAFSAQDISIGALNGNIPGGEYNSLLRFVWNPFSNHVNSVFELIRLVCANGAVGLASFLNAKVPLVNMWQENLEIASRQIQTLVETKVTRRLNQMDHESANVALTMNVVKHAERRLTNPDITETEEHMLRGIARVADPTTHLFHVYKDNVFEDMRVAEQFSSHLSKMALHNIVTEMITHTSPVDESTTNALTKMANQLMFSNTDYKSQKTIPCPFSSADNAFFGEIIV